MIRTMGDAIHDNVPALAKARIGMVAGYVTGSPDIVWTAADWAAFPGIPHVTIDQGFTGSPVATAVVRDVEAGAWTVAAAVDKTGWTASRPTIYCSASVLPGLATAGWQGDVWIADYVSSPPAAPPAMPAGMTCVAWQWTDSGGGGLYDLSVVFDESWPLMANGPHKTGTTPPPLYALPYVDSSGQAQLQTGFAVCNLCWSTFWYAQIGISHCPGNPLP